MSPLTFSVIICAYTDQRWTQLCQAIASIKAQVKVPEEIVLVIDHNSSLYSKAKSTFNDVIVVENQSQKGLSGARNHGLTLVSKDIIAFMDEDAVADPLWLKTLERQYKNRDVLGVGGAVIPKWANGRPSWFPREFDWVVGCTYLGMPTKTQPVRNFIGCNMSFRRSTLESQEGFQENLGRIGVYPAGCEETELCIRLLQQQPESKLIFEPEAKVYHHVPSTRANWNYFRSRCFAEGLSKAQVANLRGHTDGLANERSYLYRTLSAGIFNRVYDYFNEFNIASLQKSVAIVFGFVFTAFGFLIGKTQVG